MKRSGFIAALVIVFAVLLFFSSAQKETLVVGMPSTVYSLDPQIYNRTVSHAMNSHLFDSLVSLDRNSRVVPALAEKWENLDPLTWIIHIRKDVTFHNGDMLTADDVIFSFERSKNKTNFPDGITPTLRIFYKSIEKIDDYTIRISTDTPYPTYLMTMRNYFIIPKNYFTSVGQAEFAKKPIGTGPYRFISDSDGILKMERYDKYWGKKPYFKYALFRQFQDEQGIIDSLMKDDIQVAAYIGNDTYLSAKGKPKIRTISVPGFRTSYFMFDLREGKNAWISPPTNPFSDYRVRNAVRLALDLPVLIAGTLGDSGSPASQYISPYVVGYNPKLTVPKIDLAVARNLMKEAGYQQGFSCTIHVQTDEEKKLCDRVVQSLSQIGITATVAVLPADKFSAMRKKGELGFYIYSLSSGTGDALFVLSELLHSKVGYFGTYNAVGFSDSALDALIEKAAKEFNVETRLSLYQAAMEKAVALLPYVPLYDNNNVYAVNQNLKWVPRPDDRVFVFEMSW